MPDSPGSIQSSSTRSGQRILDQAKRLLGVVGPQRLMAGLLQVVGDELLDCRLIFDDQNGCGHPLSPAITAHPAIV